MTEYPLQTRGDLQQAVLDVAREARANVQAQRSIEYSQYRFDLSAVADPDLRDGGTFRVTQPDLHTTSEYPLNAALDSAFRLDTIVPEMEGTIDYASGLKAQQAVQVAFPPLTGTVPRGPAASPLPHRTNNPPERPVPKQRRRP